MSLCHEGRQLLNKLPKSKIKKLLLVAIKKIDLYENTNGHEDERDWKDIAWDEQFIFEDLLKEEAEISEILKGKGK